jgi:3-dehydroquinate synthase
MGTEAGRVRTSEVHIGERSYALHLGPGGVDAIGTAWAERKLGDAALLIFDEGVAEIATRVGVSLQAQGVRVVDAPVTPGEASKSFASLERLTRIAATNGIRRRDAVVAVGGGVVGDLAGFVAAAYQRGVPLVHVPTTLLAMVDSAIGGKTAIDIPEGKNYVGAIWQPALVVMDTSTLETLPPRELSCGFAEVVKYGLLAGEPFWSVVREWPLLPGPSDALAEMIGRCIDQKIEVVQEDEHDLGRRAILNFGHTIGHGIEAAGGYDRYRHGEAISLGMLAELRLSEQLLGLDARWRTETHELLTRHDLPVTLDADVDLDTVMESMGRDKKADGAALNMVLMADGGDPRTHQRPTAAQALAAIKELVA